MRVNFQLYLLGRGYIFFLPNTKTSEIKIDPSCHRTRFEIQTATLKYSCNHVLHMDYTHIMWPRFIIKPTRTRFSCLHVQTHTHTLLMPARTNTLHSFQSRRSCLQRVLIGDKRETAQSSAKPVKLQRNSKLVLLILVQQTFVSACLWEPC